MTSHAPIAVFGYARPDHLRDTLTSLVACDGFAESPVTVFVDGPRSPEMAERVQAVTEVARQILGAGADIRLRPKNLGLSGSITEGVSELVTRHDRVIVVEDDLELSPNFLRYMNSALDRYAEAPNVYQVSGYMFDVPDLPKTDIALFLPLVSTWGWATWSRAWRHYDPTAAGWKKLRKDKMLRRRFDLNGAYPYSWLMERQARGRSDSWGIRWYWAVFQMNGLTLFPPRSLVRNTGQDGSGTHGRGVFASFSSLGQSPLARITEFPEQLKVNPKDLALVSSAIWRQNGGWRGWGLSTLRRLLEQ